ncbi:MAG: hypothetical protein HW419_2438 [Deltaproteobacteria bacterium]|nr:hypothetical protein [Deltaproteobacteria bacterium]
MYTTTARFHFSLVVLSSLCIMITAAPSGAQDAVIDALKRQVSEMQAAMQKMVDRIEQLEKERMANTATSNTPPPEPQTAATAGPVSTGKGILNTFNPAISVNALFGGGYSTNPETTRRLSNPDFHNGFNFQEAEFQFTADVDPYWKANMILAVDRAGNVELEEGYVTSEQLPYNLLPRDTSLKLGKFFAGFGKHNLLHAHQFPFIDRPLINQAVFGDEGLKEPGLGLSYLLPTSWFSELTFQGLAGENESLFRAGEESKRRGAYLGHWKNFFDVSDSTTLEFGNSYIAGRNSDAGHRLSQAIGLDLTMKWRPLRQATEKGLIWRNEYIYFSRERERDPSSRGGGLYSSLQYQFARNWWIQGRYDLLGVPKLDDGRKNRWTTLLALVPSEFSALRLQHSYTTQTRGKSVNEILLQMNFTIGAHPAHQY